MDVGTAKHSAREWVESNQQQWPGLRGAHLVGGITSMAEDAAFPASKDVDMHLVFDENSPSLQPAGPFFNVLEVQYDGIPIEAGIKSVAEYSSPEAVLGNPEIAYHLTVDSVLFDPIGLLGGLQEPVRREYRRRQWVIARLDYERKGLAGALGLVPMARDMWGASGELNILGYTTTFLTAALSVAALAPPKMGGRMFINLRALLLEQDRADVYEEVLALLGVQDISRERAESFLLEGAEAFDLALRIKKTPHPFQHKLNAHLRPYFVDACQNMIDEGYYREALGWVLPFYCSTTDVILVDGTEADRLKYAERRDEFFRALGFDTADARVAKWEQAARLQDNVFALATEMVRQNPAIVD
jgi:hypothetical protein